MPTSRMTMQHLAAGSHFHSAMSKPTGPIRLHHPYTPRLRVWGLCHQTLGCQRHSTNAGQAMSRLLVTFYASGLDSAVGSTISLRSRSYLGEEPELCSRQVGRETVQRWLELGSE